MNDGGVGVYDGGEVGACGGIYDGGVGIEQC